MKIDFLIIGAQKSGTTTLYNWLSQHPDICLPSEKEVHFFSREENYIQGDDFLSVFYNSNVQGKIKGFADVQLMFLDNTAEKIYGYSKDVKIIAVLRNPIDRAYSAYWFARRNGIEKRLTFEDAIKDEQSGIAPNTIHEHEAMCYLKHSYYVEHLEKYLRLFGKKQIKVIFTEDLKNEPKSSISTVLDFLNCSNQDDKLSEIDFRKISNKASMPKILWLQRISHTQDSWIKNNISNMFSQKQRKWIRNNFFNKIAKLNLQDSSYPAMQNETRKRLYHHFQPFNAKIFIGFRCAKLELNFCE